MMQPELLMLGADGTGLVVSVVFGVEMLIVAHNIAGFKLLINIKVLDAEPEALWLVARAAGLDLSSGG